MRRESDTVVFNRFSDMDRARKEAFVRVPGALVKIPPELVELKDPDAIPISDIKLTTEKKSRIA